MQTNEQKNIESAKSNPISLERQIKQSKVPNLKFPSIISWLPALFPLKDNYREILNCVIGGTITALIFIPSAVAQCVMVNAPPQQGIYSIIIPPFIQALLGTSKSLNMGLLGTCLLMVYQTIADRKENHVDLQIMMSFTIGICLICFGILKLGFLENIFSLPAMTGYLCASGFTIVTEQFAKMADLSLKNTNILAKFVEIFTRISDINQANFTMSICLLACLYGIQIVKAQKFPKSLILSCHPLFSMIIGTLIMHITGLISKYSIKTPGNIPSGFPALIMPKFSLFQIVFFDALKIGVAMFTESLVISKKLGKICNQEINATWEFLSIGLANALSAFFQCFPSFGSYWRSNIQAQSGARSQLAGLISALVALIGVFTIVGAIKLVPNGFFAAFIFYSMSTLLLDLKECWFLWKNFKLDCFFFAFSFVFCLALSLIDGLILSAILSMFLLLKWSSNPIVKIEQTQSLLNLKMIIDNIEVYQKRNLIEKPFYQTSDLCLCTNFECEQECHIQIIILESHLSFINANSLKEQAQTIKNMRRNTNTVKNNNRKAKAIYGVIYELRRLRSIDFTAFQSLKVIVEDYMQNEPRIILRFSEVPYELTAKFNIIGFPNDILNDLEKGTNELIPIVFQKINENIMKNK